jgi:hypothetical protein
MIKSSQFIIDLENSKLNKEPRILNFFINNLYLIDFLKSIDVFLDNNITVPTNLKFNQLLFDYKNFNILFENYKNVFLFLFNRNAYKDNVFLYFFLYDFKNIKEILDFFTNYNYQKNPLKSTLLINTYTFKFDNFFTKDLDCFFFIIIFFYFIKKTLKLLYNLTYISTTITKTINLQDSSKYNIQDIFKDLSINPYCFISLFIINNFFNLYDFSLTLKSVNILQIYTEHLIKFVDIFINILNKCIISVLTSLLSTNIVQSSQDDDYYGFSLAKVSNLPLYIIEDVDINDLIFKRTISNYKSFVYKKDFLYTSKIVYLKNANFKKFLSPSIYIDYIFRFKMIKNVLIFSSSLNLLNQLKLYMDLTNIEIIILNDYFIGFLLTIDTVYDIFYKYTIPFFLTPGEDYFNTFNVTNYVNSLVEFYNFDNILCEKLFKLGEIYYNINSLKFVYEIIVAIRLKQDNSLQQFFNELKVFIPEELYYNQVVFLIIKHFLEINTFKQDFININFSISKYDMNKFLCIFAFSTIAIEQKLDSFDEIDKQILLTNIENLCHDKFNLMKDKSDIYKIPGCTCLYMKHNKITPICFDSKCLNNNNEFIIKEKYNQKDCVYPNCSNGISLENLYVNGNINFNKINTETNCGIYDFAKDLIPGNYLIYFIQGSDRYYWFKNANLNLITLDLVKELNVSFIDNYLFKVEINNNKLRIFDIFFNRYGVLIPKIGEFNDFLLTLLDNKLYLLDFQTGTPIVKFPDDNIIYLRIPTEITTLIYGINFELFA